MMEDEREMLLGKAPSGGGGGGGGEKKGAGRKKKRSLGGRLVVGLVGLTGAVLLLGVGVWLGGPGVAAWLTPREVAVVVGGRDGRLTIDRVEYSWGGPQRASGIRLVDGDGRVMADVEVVATTGLIEAWRSGDLGTLRLSGKVDVREEQLQGGGVSLASAGGGGGVGGVGAGGVGGVGAGGVGGVRLPTGYRFAFESKGLDLTYTPRRGEVIRVEGLDVSLGYERGGRVSLKASSRGPAVSVEVEGRNLVGADGAIAPLSAEVDVTVLGSLPGGLVGSLARAGLGGTARSGVGSEEGEVTISGALGVRGGRLRLADAGKPMRMEARALPGAVIDLIAGAGSAVAVTEAPGVVVEVSGLDVPIGAMLEGGEMDLRGAGFVARVTTTRAKVLVALAIGESAREVEIEPAEVEVRIEDFSREAVALGGASVLIDGAAAGKFKLAAVVSGMLDEKGRLKVTPGEANAEIGLVDAPTALLEPLVAGRGFSLREALGRRLDASVTARTVRGVGGGDQIEIRGAMSSEFGHGSMAVRSDGSRFWSEGSAGEFEFVRLGTAARGVLRGHGFEVTGEGVVKVEAPSFDLMLGAGAPDLIHSKATVIVTVGGLRVRRTGEDREVELRSVRTVLGLEGGPRVTATIDAEALSGGRVMGVRAEMEIAGLVKTTAGAQPRFDVGFDAKDLKGTIRLTGVPSDGLGAIEGSLAGMAREALGESVDVEVVFPAPGGTVASAAAPGETSAGIVVESERARLATALRMEKRRLSVGPTSGRIRVTPGLVAALRKLAAEDEAWWPRLEGAAEVEFSARGSSVELDDSWKPIRRTIRPVQAMVSVKTDMVLSGLPMGADGKGTDQRVGLRGVEIGGEYDFENPLASEGSVRLTVIEPTEGGATVAEVEALTNLVMPPPALNVRVMKVDTARLDRMLGRPGLTSLALGKEAGFAVVGASPGAGRAVEYEVTVASERLSVKGVMTKGADRYALAAPMVVEWEAPAAWLNAQALAAAKKGASRAALAFTAPVKLRAEVRSLSIGTENPMAAGVFALDAGVSAPVAKFVTDRGERIELEGLAVTARVGKSAGSVEFSLSAERQKAWRAEENGWAVGGAPMKIEGVVEGLADSSGSITSERARVTGRVTGSVPTALLDAVSGMDGLLVDALGPTTSVEIRAEGLSREGGRVDATAKTDFAEAKISGRVEGGELVAEGAPVVTIRRISQGLGDRVFESALPMLAQFEKTAEDEPATVTASGLRVPMDGDIGKLNGRVTMALGTLRFETSSIFGELLKATGNRTGGRIGRKVKPFDVTIENGVVRYERVELPIGEFTIVARGMVDLVNQRMDIVTFVPVLAVADEVVKVSRFAPGLTMIPIRTRGAIGKAKSEVALELILEEGLPGTILGGVGDAAGGAAEGVGGIITGLGDLLNDALKKQDEEKRKKEEKKEEKKRKKKEEGSGGGS